MIGNLNAEDRRYSDCLLAYLQELSGFVVDLLSLLVHVAGGKIIGRDEREKVLLRSPSRFGPIGEKRTQIADALSETHRVKVQRFRDDIPPNRPVSKAYQRRMTAPTESVASASGLETRERTDEWHPATGARPDDRSWDGVH